MGVVVENPSALATSLPAKEISPLSLVIVPLSSVIVRALPDRSCLKILIFVIVKKLELLTSQGGTSFLPLRLLEAKVLPKNRGQKFFRFLSVSRN